MKKRNVLSFRTKAEITIGISIILILASIGVMSMTRTITDTSDTIDTYIRNSNGNYWEATGANISIAINDCANVSGSWVKLGTANYTITGNINIWYNVTLDLMGSTIYADANFTMFTVYPLAKIMSSTTEGILDTTVVGEYNTSMIVIVPYTNTAGTPPAWQSIMSAEKRTSVEHISFISDAQEGIGLYLHVDATNENIGFMIFSDLYFKDLYRGIYLHNNDAGGFINGNLFSNIRGYNVTYFIHLYEVQNEISGNMFDGIQYQPVTTGTDIHVIYLENNCNNNMFDSINIWDWVANGDDTYSINLTSDASHNSFHGFGFMTNVNKYFNDGGTTNSFLSVSGSRFDINELETYYINRFPLSSTTGGVRFYAGVDTGIYPYTYFYGDKSGTAKFAAHRIWEGNWLFVTEEGDINFAPSTEIVEIDDILQLLPRTTDPPSLVDGMIWYNTTADLFYCRAGGSTYTFNLTAV